MKLSKTNIINMIGERDLIKSGYQGWKQEGGSVVEAADGIIRQIKANYTANIYSLARNREDINDSIRDYKKAVAEHKKPYFTKKRLQNDLMQQKQEEVFNVVDRNVSLVTLYMSIKEDISNRGRFAWLFHPIRTYRENKALQHITDTFEEFNISKGYVNTLREILQTEDYKNLEIDVSENANEISYEKVAEKLDVETDIVNVEIKDEEETMTDMELFIETVQPEQNSVELDK